MGDISKDEGSKNEKAKLTWVKPSKFRFSGDTV